MTNLSGPLVDQHSHAGSLTGEEERSLFTANYPLVGASERE